MDIVLAITVGLLSILLVTWYRWRKRQMSLFEQLGIPGPKPHFIRGNVDSTSKQADLSLEWVKKYGNIFGIYLGARPFLVVSDLELLKIIEIKEFRNFCGRSRFTSDLVVAHPITHENMFAKSGDQWKHARSAIIPAFATGKLKRMMPTIREAIDIFLNKVAEQGNETFDIMPLLRKLSFDINSKAAFGVETNVQDEDNNLFVRSVYRSFDSDAGDFLAKALIYFPELHPLPQLARRIRDEIRVLIKSPCSLSVLNTCAQIIKARKENPQSARPDFLQTLIDASKDKNNNESNRKGNNAHFVLSEKEVLANAFGFMLAGFDIIGVIASFCTRYIVENPDVQEKLHEEIERHFKDELDYDMLSKMTYLDQILSETLRMFPFNVVGINRKASKKFNYGNITIPKGMNVAIPIHVLNMNPDYWEQPKLFNPDRFSPENGEINNVVYQPFGAGPRNCLGIRFSQIVMKSILASLFKAYKLHKPPDAKPFELEYTIFMARPKYGVQVGAIPV